MKILAVDDDLVLLGLIAFALRQAGYLVIESADGGAALADFAREQPDLSPSQMNLLYIAKNTPGALMNAASAGQDMLCRVFGKCLSGNPIDREIGDLIGASGPTGEKLFTYMRYDADVSRKGLDALGLPDVNPAHVQLLDSVRYIDEIQRVGKAVAAKCVKAEDFAGF